MNFTSNCLRAFEPCDSATSFEAALWHIFHSNAHAYRLYVFNEPPRSASLFLSTPLRSAKPCIVAQLFAPQQVFLLAASLFLLCRRLTVYLASALRCDQRSPAVYAIFGRLVESCEKFFRLGCAEASRAGVLRSVPPRRWPARAPMAARQAHPHHWGVLRTSLYRCAPLGSEPRRRAAGPGSC